VPLVILRVISVLALILLLWNPASSRTLPSGDQPIVLLDASLSLDGAPFRAALDSARTHAGRGALVWRFGTGVTAFDSAPPRDGATRLGPALEAAAGRAGEVIVVSDGRIDDATTIPPDLLRRPRVIVIPRPDAFDAYVASVDGRRHVTRSDTVRLSVSYGAGGKRDTGNGKRNGTLTVSLGDRRLASQRVSLPDSGTLSTELTFPVSRVPFPGWQVLEVHLDGVNDAESRDDARLFAIEVSLEPAAVVFDAIVSAKAKGRDPVLIDTAGRLHTRVNLMNELDKICRIAAREVPGAPHDVLLVLDATVGQNGVMQAREFASVAGVNGIVLTKLDGTAKGGVAVAIANDLKLPIRYVGVGEGIDDLVPFSADEYVNGLFEEKW